MKFFSLLLSSVTCLALVNCGGENAQVEAQPVGTVATAVTVGMSDCADNLPPASNQFNLAVNGSGYFRMNSNGAISYIKSGRFQLETTTAVLACLSYPSF